jgi:hypothetical protein
VLINFIELNKETIQSDIMSTIEAVNILNHEDMVDREFLKLNSKVLELKKFQRFNIVYILHCEICSGKNTDIQMQYYCMVIYSIYVLYNSEVVSLLYHNLSYLLCKSCSYLH